MSRRRLAQGATSTRPRTDFDLGYLKGLSNLAGLSLWRTGVTGTGFSHLKGLTGLQSLYLYNTQITDAGLVHLKGLTNLQSLDIGGFGPLITDAGLVHLKGLTKLQTLQLSGQITDVGVADLQKALPNCKIYAAGRLVTTARPTR